MRFLIPLAVAAAFAAPAFAQDATPAPQSAPPAAAEAQSPEEAALEAKAEAFEARMDQMSDEIDAIVSDMSKDDATATAEADAVINRYGPEMATFGTEVAAFLRAEAEKPENAEGKDQMLAGAARTETALSGMAEQIRGQVHQAIAARHAASSAAPAE